MRRKSVTEQYREFELAVAECLIEEAPLAPEVVDSFFRDLGGWVRDCSPLNLNGREIWPLSLCWSAPSTESAKNQVDPEQPQHSVDKPTSEKVMIRTDRHAKLLHQ
jgi:hypothetical protein